MRIATLVLVLIFAACAAQAQQGNTEVTFDGLTKLQQGPYRESWADLDVEFTQYTKVLLVDPYFEFRAVKRTSPAAARRSNQKKYYISDRNRERLIQTVGEIFAAELGNSKTFTIADEPGPDVAILQVGVFDIVSRVPPESVGRSEIYLSSVGEGTLVVELKDSLSFETVFRGVERRAAQRAMGELRLSNSVTNWAEVRRLANRWARTMREGLDAIHDQ